MEPLEIFMEYYNKLVPHIYIPEPAVMEVCSGFVLIHHVEGHPSLLLLFGRAGGDSVCCFHGVHALTGDRGATVVKVLCYKSEGRWFDPRWCHWNISLT